MSRGVRRKNRVINCFDQLNEKERKNAGIKTGRKLVAIRKLLSRLHIKEKKLLKSSNSSKYFMSG